LSSGGSDFPGPVGNRILAVTYLLPIPFYLNEQCATTWQVTGCLLMGFGLLALGAAHDTLSAEEPIAAHLMKVDGLQCGQVTVLHAG
jgi:hypothetical protein